MVAAIADQRDPAKKVELFTDAVSGRDQAAQRIGVIAAVHARGISGDSRYAILSKAATTTLGNPITFKLVREGLIFARGLSNDQRVEGLRATYAAVERKRQDDRRWGGQQQQAQYLH
jgi:hypothetical protein